MSETTLRIASDERAKPITRRINFTVRTLEAVKCRPGQSEVCVWDTKVPALAYRVRASGAAAYYLVRRVNGRFKRMRLGGADEITIEQARRQAETYNGQAAQGIDPTEARREARANRVTLQETWDEFKADRKNRLKAQTLAGYGDVIERAFSEWMKRPARDLTRDVVLTLHRRLGQNSGAAYANRVMRTLSSVMAFAGKKGYVTGNPVDVLRREWFKVSPRKSRIPDEDLAAWFTALEAVRNDPEHPTGGVGADYLEFTLLHGLRRNESARLTWDRVDLEKKTLTITDTKNSDPLVLPLSDRAADLLIRRKATGHGQWVFPSMGTRGKGKPITEPRYFAELVKAAGGMETTIHDLRRTFISAAVRLVPYAVVKALVNHRAKKKGDITLDYVALATEDLRPHVQRIADFFTEAANRKPAEQK